MSHQSYPHNLNSGGSTHTPSTNSRSGLPPPPPPPPHFSGSGMSGGFYPAPPRPHWHHNSGSYPTAQTGFTSDYATDYNGGQNHEHTGYGRRGGGYGNSGNQGNWSDRRGRGGGRGGHGGYEGRGGRGDHHGGSRGRQHQRDGQSHHAHPTDGARYFLQSMLVDPWVTPGLITAGESRIADQVFAERVRAANVHSQGLDRDPATSKSTTTHPDTTEFKSNAVSQLFASLPPAKSSEVMNDTVTTASASPPSGLKFGSLLASLPKPQNSKVVSSTLGTDAPAIVLSSTSGTQLSEEPSSQVQQKVDASVDLYALLNQESDD